MASRESADVVFLRKQQEINEEYNTTTAKRTPTGAQVVLTPRQQARILEALEGCSDEVAQSVRDLLAGVPEEEPMLAGGLHEVARADESAGQTPDPTSLAFWYASGTVSEPHVLTYGPVPHTPSGWGPAWLRRLRRRRGHAQPARSAQFMGAA